jgi:hypothetical protein
MIVITRESIFYINLRQAYLMQPSYTKKLSSRTVLFRAVPEEYLNEKKLRRILGPHVVRVWLPTDTKHLQRTVDGLAKIAQHLEKAQTKYIMDVNEIRLKSLKDHTNTEETGENNSAVVESSETLAQLTARVGRPTHREKGFSGEKLDTINWTRDELRTVIPIVKSEQDKHRRGEVTKIRAVFVEFDSLGEAQAAYQSLTHHHIMTMSPRFTGIHPTDIIWYNLRMKGYEHLLRLAASLGAVLGLTLFWAIPTAFIGAISNADVAGANQSHRSWLHWLQWLHNAPAPLRGFITGPLPTILLSLLMALVPIILRYIAIFGGAPSYTAAEQTLQNTHFAFQIVQTFLVTTIGSASSILFALSDPKGFANLLAQGLPKVSNFFINYIITQGFGVFASILVGLAGIILTPLLANLSGRSPRKIFLQWNRLAAVGWGTVYPRYTALFVIGKHHLVFRTSILMLMGIQAIAYSCVSPIILFFSTLSLILLYVAHRYNILFVYDTGVDMKGSAYPTALQHLFVGLYIAELCLLGLFATQLGNSSGKASGPFVLMIILVVVTALYHTALNTALGPLMKYLPKTLETETLEREPEEETTEGNAIEADVKVQVDVKSDQEHIADTDERPATAEMGVAKSNARTEPGRLARFFKPHIFDDYIAMERMLKSMDLVTVEAPDDVNIVRDAYLPPAVWAELPHLLIPRDEAGLSAEECRLTSEVLPCTDNAARLDERNHIIVDDNAMREICIAEKEQRIMEY